MGARTKRRLDRLLVVEDVARVLGCHPETVREMLRRGSLKGERIGKRWYVRPNELGVTLARNGER